MLACVCIPGSKGNSKEFKAGGETTSDRNADTHVYIYHGIFGRSEHRKIRNEDPRIYT